MIIWFYLFNLVFTTQCSLLFSLGEKHIIKQVSKLDYKVDFCWHDQNMKHETVHITHDLKCVINNRIVVEIHWSVNSNTNKHKNEWILYVSY